MNSRQIYAYAYRQYRANKGNAAIRSSKASVNAWKSYDENFKYSSDQVLYGYDALEQQLWKYHRPKWEIHSAYHFNTNFRLSKAF